MVLYGQQQGTNTLWCRCHMVVTGGRHVHCEGFYYQMSRLDIYQFLASNKEQVLNSTEGKVTSTHHPSSQLYTGTLTYVDIR